MKNPWSDLPELPPYILPSDEDKINFFNRKVSSDDYKIITDQLPGPYVGNPLNANVVIFTLNPGYSALDNIFHKPEHDFWKDLRANLEHKPIEFPFYYLNNNYKECGGHKYWYPFLREVIKAIEGRVDSPVKTISRKLAVLEWFPYHSSYFSWKFMLCGLESQKYSHWLAEECLKSGKIVIIHRAYNWWEETVSSLAGCITHKNGKPPRNWYLNKDNLKDGDFEKICEAIYK